jgi:hypothetical protein
MDNELLVRIRLIKVSYAYSPDFTVLLARITYYSRNRRLKWSCSKYIITARPAKQAIAPYSLFLKNYARSSTKLRYT